jgi:hypothetical protein
MYFNDEPIRNESSHMTKSWQTEIHKAPRKHFQMQSMTKSGRKAQHIVDDMGSENKPSRGKHAESTNGTSSSKQSKANGEPLAKRPKLLTDGGDSESSSSDAEEPVFKINEEFAKRFEHNKKREELQRRKFLFRSLLQIISISGPDLTGI